jgi:hypothetical protein
MLFLKKKKIHALGDVYLNSLSNSIENLVEEVREELVEISIISS